MSSNATDAAARANVSAPSSSPASPRLGSNRVPATPLPWAVNLSDKRMVLANDARATIVCTSEGSESNPDVVQDAAYIVHACNNYWRLVASIKDAIREMDVVWIEANALRDSKAAGEMARNLRKVLRELGEL